MKTFDTILILDTETTGVEPPPKSTAIEVACALYSVPHACVLMTYSSLIFASENPAERVNGIPTAVLHCASSSDVVWEEIDEMSNGVGAVLAHNAPFDRQFVKGTIGLWDSPPWICTMSDLAWPKATKPTQNLVSLALAHGLGVSHAHRAAVDVDLICRLLTRVSEMGVDLQGFLARGLRPKARFVALEPYERKDLVKAQGFHWDGSVWSRTMAVEDAEQLPIRVQRVSECF